MKRLLFLLILFLMPSVYAINWETIEAPNGYTASIDMDSLLEYKNYYLYNIKVFNEHTKKYVVITMQSGIRNGLTSRIRYYSYDDYVALNGDYDNITKNVTKSFEPMQFGSIAHTCYLKVKSKFESNKIQIQL